MLGEVLALCNAVTGAGSNVSAGAAVRRSNPVSVLLVATPVTLVVALAVAFATGHAMTGMSLGWGTSAGVMGGIGLWCSYRAFELGRVAVVVPVTTCAAVIVQVSAGWLLEERPATWTLLGAFVCLMAVVVIARGREGAEPGQRPVFAIVLALAAGVCFAAFVVFISRGNEQSPGWVLVAARAGVLAVILTLAATSRTGLPNGSRAWGLAGLAGALDVAGNLLLVAALSVSNLALVSAIAAITPVVAAVLAITFLGERINRWQVVGLALGLVGVWLVILS